ncbi:Lipolytic protein G-D-S-L family [Alteracholeplasma palmae J233]|uniref:Lipolytic protein G-D-S-L family n=1 Tax=Alteracholeplasma palmae (strain ATCC 49389 / J233) TaxID=1318466 RepID=U4KL26_ALTPJ|nr:lipolytic protein G-D-S-L family [Alteracholeplasma palmae]CCV64418.1 Lipolytic protein G-D-S-L family [Alteracholeplasma palmae J233]
MEKILLLGNSLISKKTIEANKALEYNIEDVTEIGMTIDTGYKKLKQILKINKSFDFVVLSFGGNDWEYVWKTTDDKRIFLPKTSFEKFKKTYKKIIKLLKKNHIKPVLISLPPLEAKKYYDWILTQIEDKNNLASTLKTEEKVARYHELYNLTIYELFVKYDTKLIDLNKEFMNDNKKETLLSEDGVSLNLLGQDKANSILMNKLRNLVL